MSDALHRATGWARGLERDAAGLPAAAIRVREEVEEVVEELEKAERELKTARLATKAAKALWKTRERERDEARDALSRLGLAWEDADVHPRHAPGTCKSCDEAWEAYSLVRLEVKR